MRLISPFHHWSRCVCHVLWALLPVVCFPISFPVRRCGYEELYVHLCVCSAGVSLHKLLWLYQVNFFWGNTSWPRRLLLGPSYNPLQRSRPNYLSLSLPALMPRDIYSLYRSFLWEKIDSGLSSLNTVGTFKLCSVCSFSSNSVTVYLKV